MEAPDLGVCLVLASSERRGSLGGRRGPSRGAHGGHRPTASWHGQERGRGHGAGRARCFFGLASVSPALPPPGTERREGAGRAGRPPAPAFGGRQRRESSPGSGAAAGKASGQGDEGLGRSPGAMSKITSSRGSLRGRGRSGSGTEPDPAAPQPPVGARSHLTRLRTYFSEVQGPASEPALSFPSLMLAGRIAGAGHGVAVAWGTPRARAGSRRTAGRCPCPSLRPGPRRDRGQVESFIAGVGGAREQLRRVLLSSAGILNPGNPPSGFWPRSGHEIPAPKFPLLLSARHRRAVVSLHTLQPRVPPSLR